MTCPASKDGKHKWKPCSTVGSWILAWSCMRCRKTVMGHEKPKNKVADCKSVRPTLPAEKALKLRDKA